MPRNLIRDRGAVLILSGLGGLIGTAALVWLIIWLFSAEKAQAKVSKLTWEHRVDLREREVRRNSDWGKAYRDGYYNEPTFNQHCERRRRGTRCCGGFDSDNNCISSCPDYDDWCTYNYYEWPIIKTKTIQGDGHGELSWPEFAEDVNHRTKRYEKYFVDFKNGDKIWSYWTKSLDRYNEFEIDEVWDLRLPHVGGVDPTAKAQLEKD